MQEQQHCESGLKQPSLTKDRLSSWLDAVILNPTTTIVQLQERWSGEIDDDEYTQFKNASLLHLAIYSDRADLVDHLLQRSVDLEATCKYCWTRDHHYTETVYTITDMTPLYFALYNYKEHLVAKLLSAGANVNCRCNECSCCPMYGITHWKGVTPLYQASSMKLTSIVPLLEQYGADRSAVVTEISCDIGDNILYSKDHKIHENK